MKCFRALWLISLYLTSCQTVSVAPMPTSTAVEPTPLPSPSPVPTFPSIDRVIPSSESVTDLSSLVPITTENAVNLKPFLVLAHSSINSLAWSPDGKAILAATSQGLKLYSSGSLQEKPLNLSPFPTQSYFVLFSPMGTQMVWAEPTSPNDFSLWAWDLVTGEKRFIPMPNGKLLGISFDLREQLIIATLFDNAIKVWLAESQTLLTSFRGVSDARWVEFSPDAQRIVSVGHADLMAHVWNVESGQEIGSIGKPDMQASSVAFNPKGNTLAVGYQGAVQLWDLDTWSEIDFRRIASSRSVTGLVFSPDGSLLAVPIMSDIQMMILDSELNPVAEIENGGARFSPDGKTMAVLRGGGVKLFDTSTWQVLDALAPPLGPVQQMVFRTDKPTLVSIHSIQEDNMMVAWDLQTASEISRIAAPGEYFLSPDGKFLAIGARSGDVSVWDVDTGNMLKSLSRESEWGISAIRFSRDNHLLTISYAASTISVAFWEWQTDQEPKVYPLAEGLSYIGSLTPDGTKMAVWIVKNEIPVNVGVWDAETRSLRNVSQRSESGWIASAALHPNSEMIAVGDRWDGSISVYDVNSGIVLKELNKLERPPDYDVPVNDILFSNSGKFMVTRIRGWPVIWNLEDYTFINIQADCINSVESIAFSQDDQLFMIAGDKTVTTGGVEGRVCLWETRTGKLLASLGDSNTYTANFATFNREGTMIATDDHGTIWLWGISR